MEKYKTMRKMKMNNRKRNQKMTNKPPKLQIILSNN